MRAQFFSQFAVALLIAAGFSACSGPESPGPTDSQWAVGLNKVKIAVSTATGYSVDAVDATASPAHLRLSVADKSLAESDQITRENLAGTVVAAVESVIRGQEQFKATQVISVAIIHPQQSGTNSADTHVEDVLEFRKGPNQRFTHHVT